MPGNLLEEIFGSGQISHYKTSSLNSSDTVKKMPLNAFHGLPKQIKWVIADIEILAIRMNQIFREN